MPRTRPVTWTELDSVIVVRLTDAVMLGLALRGFASAWLAQSAPNTVDMKSAKTTFEDISRLCIKIVSSLVRAPGSR